MTPANDPRDQRGAVRAKPDPADVEDLHAAIVESEGADGQVIEPADLRHWAETGEWPEGD